LVEKGQRFLQERKLRCTRQTEETKRRLRRLDAERKAQARANETPEQKQAHRARNAFCQALRRERRRQEETLVRDVAYAKRDCNE